MSGGVGMISEISRNEYDALTLSLDKTRLRKRLNEAKALLYDEARAMFRPGIFKPAERALYSDSPFGYRLQWSTRPYPHAPESVDNQQTSTGSVRLVKLERPL
jgi:hypothetical protein